MKIPPPAATFNDGFNGPGPDPSIKVVHKTAVAVPGIVYPGGYQLPFTHVQSGPGFTVGHADPGGGGGVADGGGSVGGAVAAADPRGSGIRAAASCR